MNDKKEQLAVQEEKKLVYQVNGEEVELTRSIVKKFVARGNTDITDAEAFMFMKLCQHRKLNPFVNDAYLIKFGSECQTVVGKEAYMKRAEESNALQGHQAGIIVERNGESIEVEGCFLLPTDKLVGGWAKVYRSDRKFPIVMTVSLKEYDKGQSNWKTKPSTMIRKVALVQALREAFPNDLSGMYVEDEMPELDKVKVVQKKVDDNANQQPLDFQDEVEVIDLPETTENEEPGEEPGEKQAKSGKTKPASQPVQQEIVIEPESDDPY